MGYEETSFQLLLYAGNAKAELEQALKFAQSFKFDEARAAIKRGDEELVKAHKANSDLLHSLAQGDAISCDILLAHAMDHLMVAEERMFFVSNLVALYELIAKKMN